MNLIKTLFPKHIRILILGIFILISTIIFIKIVDDVFSGKSGNQESLVNDQLILKKIFELKQNSLTQIMTDITALGSVSVIMLIICVIVILLITHKDWSGLTYILIVASGSLIIPVLLKNYFNRERPDVLQHLAIVNNSSFPSGHSFGATVAYLSFAFLLSREIKQIKLEVLYYFLAAVIILFVGVSRMYLGVHFPTDVVGGICAGMIWFSIVSITFLNLTKK